MKVFWVFFFLFLFFSGRGEGKYKKKSKYLVKLSMRTPALYAGLLLEVKVLYRSVIVLTAITVTT